MRLQVTWPLLSCALLLTLPHATCNAHAMHQTTDMIGSDEACRILNISRSTLTRRVADGRITPVARSSESINGAFLFRRGDVEKLAKAEQAAA